MVGVTQGEKHAKLIAPRALLLDDTRFDLHASGAYHPERPERLVAARKAIQTVSADWLRVAARDVTASELARVHAHEFVDKLDSLRGWQGYLDADTFIAPKSVELARLAAGGTVALVDRLVRGDVARGVVLARPPGHHALRDRAMGFCLFNNVAIASAHARAMGLSRVAIVDWDAHHGNGTQEIFWSDPNVLYLSTHQHPFFPGTGTTNERGAGDGTGYTVNIPLLAGSGDSTYRAAFERIILPVLDEFRPELILISAGYDAALRDPLAQLELSSAAFGWMAAEVAAIADKHAPPGERGKVALVLEGGYDLVSLESGLEASLRGLLWGTRSPIGASSNDESIAWALRAASETWREVR